MFVASSNLRLVPERLPNRIHDITTRLTISFTASLDLHTASRRLFALGWIDSFNLNLDYTLFICQQPGSGRGLLWDLFCSTERRVCILHRVMLIPRARPAPLSFPGISFCCLGGFPRCISWYGITGRSVTSAFHVGFSSPWYGLDRPGTG